METSTSVATAVTSAVGDVVSGIGTVVDWWFIPIVVGIFAAGVVISLVASFFGKRGKRRGK